MDFKYTPYCEDSIDHIPERQDFLIETDWKALVEFSLYLYRFLKSSYLKHQFVWVTQKTTYDYDSGREIYGSMRFMKLFAFENETTPMCLSYFLYLRWFFK